MIRIICLIIVGVYVHIFYRLKVYGKKNFPKGGGIICSNHCSFIDPPLIGVSCPGKVHFLGRDTLFKSSFFAWLIRKLNTHPVHRGKGNVHAFKMAIELIKQDKKVVIFPEGRRSPDGEFMKGQLGVSMLVQKTKCQVIPIYIYGTYEIWNTKRRFPKIFGKAACVIGKALTFQDLEKVDRKQAQEMIMDRIMGKIGELKQWYLAGAKGTPP